MKSTITCGTVRFIDLPEYFLERYADEINAWSANIRKIGLVKSFVLREGHLAGLSENGFDLIQVKLICKPWERGVEISPLRERDRDLIAAHCDKMQAAKVPSRAVLVEPPRAGVPFMPDRYH